MYLDIDETLNTISSQSLLAHCFSLAYRNCKCHTLLNDKKKITASLAMLIPSLHIHVLRPSSYCVLKLKRTS